MNDARQQLYDEFSNLHFELLDCEEEEAQATDEFKELALEFHAGSLDDEDVIKVYWQTLFEAVGRRKDAVDKCAAALQAIYEFEVENFPNYYYAHGTKQSITLVSDRFAVDLARVDHELFDISGFNKSRALHKIENSCYQLRIYSDEDADRVAFSDNLKYLIPVYTNSRADLICFLPEVRVSCSSKSERDKIGCFLAEVGGLQTCTFTEDGLRFYVTESPSALRLANEIYEKFQVDASFPRMIQVFQPR
jgi:hypothetical protein